MNTDTQTNTPQPERARHVMPPSVRAEASEYFATRGEGQAATATPAHTPTPWQASNYQAGAVRVCTLKTIVATIYAASARQQEIAEANAAFIVQACNSHAALVARVADLEAAIQWAIDHTGPHKQLLRVVGKNTFPALAVGGAK